MKRSYWFALVLAIATTAAPGLGQSPGPDRLQVNDIELAYDVRGAGEPLLLLHNFGGCGRQWAPFADSLAARYKLIIPDMRGHGASTNPSGVFTHSQAARDILVLLDHLGLDRVKAIGISSGGMTLLHMATLQPDRIDAMVLVGATSHFPDEARRIMRRVASDSIPAGFREHFASCATRGNAQAEQLRSQFGGFKDSYDDMNFTAPYLATIKARTLIVHGDRDEYFPVHIPVEMYRAIPRSSLWIVPQGGHIPIFGARAREFQGVVLTFLAGVSNRL